MIKIWNIYARANSGFWLINIICQLLHIIWIWNMHWGCFLINEVGQWFSQLDHMTFFKNILWSVNFALPFYQICYNMKTEFPQSRKFPQSRMHTPISQIRVKANGLMYFLNLQKLNFPSKEFLFLKKIRKHFIIKIRKRL